MYHHCDYDRYWYLQELYTFVFLKKSKILSNLFYNDSFFLHLFLHSRLVEETLKPLDPKRRAFRLIGGVLVERTVEEVLPSITDNLSNVSDLDK